MARIIWSDDAAEQLNAIVDFIEQENREAARKIAEEIVLAALSLEHFPDRGRRAGKNTRELVNVWPYIIRYRVEAADVRILGVRHGARLPPIDDKAP